MNNLNRKTLIQIVAIGICFLGSGYVLYNGFFKKNSAVVTLNSATSNGVDMPGKVPAKNIDKILPNGNSLDFKILDRPDVQYGTTLWVNSVTSNEIGILETEMVKSQNVSEDGAGK